MTNTHNVDEIKELLDVIEVIASSLPTDEYDSVTGTIDLIKQKLNQVREGSYNKGLEDGFYNGVKFIETKGGLELKSLKEKETVK